MKINGLNLANYWIVNFWFNYLYYSITAFIFFVVGKYIFEMIVFVKTSTMIWFFVLNGWGLSQISLAFFMSVFIRKSAMASIVGYALSITLMFLAAMLSDFVYRDYTASWYFFLIPTFTF